MKIIQVKDNQSVPMNLFLFVKERGIFRTRATLQAPRPYLRKEIVQMQPRRHIFQTTHVQVMTQKTVKNTPSSKLPKKGNVLVPRTMIARHVHSLRTDFKWTPMIVATSALKEFVKRSLVSSQITVMKAETVHQVASAAVNAALNK